MQFVAIVVTAVGAAALWTAFLQRLAHRYASSPPGLSELLVGCAIGLIVGLVLACSARCGSRPPLRARFFVSKIAALLCFVAFAAAVGGIGGYLSGSVVGLRLWDPHFAAIPRAAHPAFLALFGAGLFSAFAGLCGGVLLGCFAAKARRLAARAPAQ